MYYNINILYVQYFHSFIHPFTHTLDGRYSRHCFQPILISKQQLPIAFYYFSSNFLKNFQNLSPLQPIPVKILKECSKRCVI